MSVPADQMNTGLRNAVEEGVRAGDPNASEIPEAEIAAVKKLFTQYSVARDFDKVFRQAMARNRRYAAGTANPNWASDANILGAFIDILQAFLYAKDPDVSVRPAARVSPTPEEQAAFAMVGGDKSQLNAQKFSETAQIVISQQWRKAKLKRTMKRMLRASLSVSTGWFKALMYSPEMNPLLEKELSDLQDNLKKIQALQADLVETTQEDIDEKRTELESQITAVQAHAELSVKKGLCIDFVRTEDVQVSLDVASESEYLDADWISHDVYVEVCDAGWRFPRLTKDDIATATKYVQRQTGQDRVVIDQTMAPNTALPEGTFVKATDNVGIGSAQVGLMGGNDKPVEFIKAVELWDHRDMKVKTMVDGVKRWARDPYPPPYAASRFYPFFALALYEVDGQRHAQSLPDRVCKLQDEYSSRRSSGRKMRERSIPGIILDGGQVDPANVDRIRKSEEQEITVVRLTTPGLKVSDVVTEKPVSRIDPLVFDTKEILYDMNVVTGVQEAQASGVSQANTATEADINQSGFTSRTGADRDTEEDMLTEFAQYTLEIAVQGLSTEEVQRIAGPYAVWPEGMPVDEILTLVDVEIKAGTTGKPRAQADKEAWATLLPLIMDMLAKIQLATQMGDVATEQTLKNILNETLKRLDDRLSIESILAPAAAPVMAPGMPGASPTSAPPGAAAPPEAPPGAEGPPTGNGTINNPIAQGAPPV
jgi:hypothetical protein